VLAPLTVGQTDLLPYYFKVNAGRRGNVLASYELENPRRLLLGRFDLAFVIVFVLPVALLIAGYGALAAEREEGRLALLMAHGITPRRLALTRVAVRCGLLLALTIAAVLLALTIAGFDVAANGAVTALIEWLTVALAYGVFWAAVTLLVVAFARSTSTAALSLAGTWLVLVVIAPWALNLAANRIHPLPSRTAYVLAQRDASDAAEAQGSALLGRYLQDHPEFAPANTPIDAMHYSATDIATTRHVEAQLQPIEAEFDARLAGQQRVIDRWQWLSPAVLVQQAFNELAGAGRSRHRAFLAQATAHIDALRSYFNPRILRGEFTFNSFDEWPRYAWQEPAPVEEQRRTRWALLGLLIPAGTVLAIALWALSGRRATLRALAA
jgi:ABC-2 type transport system permease protein